MRHVLVASVLALFALAGCDAANGAADGRTEVRDGGDPGFDGGQADAGSTDIGKETPDAGEQPDAGISCADVGSPGTVPDAGCAYSDAGADPDAGFGPAVADSEEYLVWTQVQTRWYGVTNLEWVIRDHTVEIDSPSSEWIAAAFPGIDPSTITGYTQYDKPDDRYRLACGFSFGTPVYFLGDAEFDVAVAGDTEWETFGARHPGSHGVYEISRVGFNGARDEALVLVGSYQGYLSAAWYLLHLRKICGVWEPVEYKVVGAS